MTDPSVATTFPDVTTSPELSPDLTRRLTAARRKAEAARRRAADADADLNAIVREAREAGASLRKVAEAAGLSHTQVKFVVDGRPPRKPAGASEAD